MNKSETKPCVISGALSHAIPCANRGRAVSAPGPCQRRPRKRSGRWSSSRRRRRPRAPRCLKSASTPPHNIFPFRHHQYSAPPKIKSIRASRCPCSSAPVVLVLSTVSHNPRLIAERGIPNDEPSCACHDLLARGALQGRSLDKLGQGPALMRIVQIFSIPT